MEIVGVIPARFASTRLPGKALLSETGQPLILHVIEAARRSRSLQRIIVATDDDRIAQAVTGFGGEVMMTRTDHATGTDRVAEVAGRLERAGIIVNLQGDEPEISGHALDLVVALAGQRPRGPDGHARDADPRRVDLSRPGVRQGRLRPARPGTLLLAEPDPLPSRRPSRARHGRCRRSPTCTSAFTRTAATSCSISGRFPLRRWRPPRSSSSSACSKPATRSPSAWSTSPASASTHPKIIAGSSPRWRASQRLMADHRDHDEPSPIAERIPRLRATYPATSLVRTLSTSLIGMSRRRQSNNHRVNVDLVVAHRSGIWCTAASGQDRREPLDPRRCGTGCRRGRSRSLPQPATRPGRLSGADRSQAHSGGPRAAHAAARGRPCAREILFMFTHRRRAASGRARASRVRTQPAAERPPGRSGRAISGACLPGRRRQRRLGRSGEHWFEPTSNVLAEANPADSPPAAPESAPVSPPASRPEMPPSGGKSALAALGFTGESMNVKGQFVLRVSSVEQGGPAQRSGLEPGDIVIGANDKPLGGLDQLVELARRGRSKNLLVLDINTGKTARVPIEVTAAQEHQAAD